MGMNDDWVADMTYHLNEALDRASQMRDELNLTKLPMEYTIVPVYAIEDAIERLKRYDTITMNLLKVAMYLWCDKNGIPSRKRTTHRESPYTAAETDAIKNQAVFTHDISGEFVNDDMAFIELALQFARMRTGDPTGLEQYLNKEDDLFDRLYDEIEDTNG